MLGDIAKGLHKKDPFTLEEKVALLRLRQHYQTNGSDRVPVLRHWQFLRFLIANKRLEA